jgi:hypothetical protein
MSIAGSLSGIRETLADQGATTFRNQTDGEELHQLVKHDWI